MNSVDNVEKKPARAVALNKKGTRGVGTVTENLIKADTMKITLLAILFGLLNLSCSTKYMVKRGQVWVDVSDADCEMQHPRFRSACEEEKKRND